MNDLWKLKEEQFIEVLAILESYGFKYYEKDKQYQNNLSQSIQFSYYRLDPNLCVPRVYIINPSVDEKRKILNVNEEFRNICKKRFKTEKYKLAYIVKNQLEIHNSLFGLSIVKGNNNEIYQDNI